VEAIVTAILFLGAVVICVPILVVSMGAAYLLTLGLDALGVSDTIQGAVILLGGLAGGLVACFFALRFISRRLPTQMRAYLYGSPSPVTDHTEPMPVFGRDPDADPVSVEERVRAADDALSRPDEELDRPA
jgi:uncharacterized sodium:solute symporter family permease YidK